MPAFFLDSSALVKCYFREQGSDWISAIVQPEAGNNIFVAQISGVEVISAMARRVRGGGVSSTDAQIAITNFRHDFFGGFTNVELTASILVDAMRLAQVFFLRGYDAVQLASAIQVRSAQLAAGIDPAKLISSDLELNQAARAEGFSVDDPNLHA